MSSLQFTERNILEKILGMRTGYVSDFSDRTLREFVLEKAGVDVFTEAYEELGTSKANRLRSFWKKEPDKVTAVLIEALLEYALNEKTNYDRELHGRDENLFIEARKIVQRLKDESNAEIPRSAPMPSLEGPHPGVFIAARRIKNDGSISGPMVDVITEHYSGKGSVSAPRPHKDAGTRPHFLEKLTNNQTFAIVVGGLILAFVFYFIYRHSGVNLSQF